MNCLRGDKLNVSARRLVWRYEWDAQKEKNPLGVVENGHHDLKPFSKNTGKLTPAYDTVSKLNILCVITLNNNNTISSPSYQTLVPLVNPDHVLSRHLSVKSLHLSP